MKSPLLAGLCLAAMLCASHAPAMAAPAPANLAAALADPARSAADRALDAPRKAADILGFVALRPGDKVADIYPGAGYYTRLFSKAVGPTGKVYGVFKTVSANAAKLPASRRSDASSRYRCTSAWSSSSRPSSPACRPRN